MLGVDRHYDFKCGYSKGKWKALRYSADCALVAQRIGDSCRKKNRPFVATMPRHGKRLQSLLILMSIRSCDHSAGGAMVGAVPRSEVTGQDTVRPNKNSSPSTIPHRFGLPVQRSVPLTRVNSNARSKFRQSGPFLFLHRVDASPAFWPICAACCATSGRNSQPQLDQTSAI